MPKINHKITPKRRSKSYKKWTVVAMVTSSKDDGSSYIIYKRTIGEWKCTCLAYRFTQGKVGSKFPCKHLRRFYKYSRKLASGEIKSVSGITVVEIDAM